ncbi:MULTISPECIES: sensor histidine kinase [Streptomyces]|uniref:sensor histidine kinase n=1 Tax=Streptomyces TaxID=1883 RepID=UPI00163CD80D|nr:MULTISPECIES: HAMP domain-containing sensor histidine kinase [Streptomyces]MBC2874986.1 HAMP domain-containing histidine kinase [Streptomyces sp. TYQ1024]UBI37423.1 HAMP domain-containing histidine kinase [Streptomyces mobaraensis]UKW30014.1 HAMP domain-containing histidine kinase [Streptomyces sp. TYQ1024]
MIKRFRRLPLRSRLALLTAAAVAVAVAVAAGACWILTKEQLEQQRDTTLSRQKVADDYVQGLLDRCGTRVPDKLVSPSPYTIQAVTADGVACTQLGRSPVRVAVEDLAVATGRLDDALHDARADDGTEMRVATSRVTPGIAVMIAQPVSDVDRPMNALAIVLVVTAGIGVLGAAAIGLVIARAALRPVDQLTGAVEHIARTEDLAVRIPAEGEDEIARLSRSFNSMTAALASSRDRQQQLIADAGHELRTPLTSLRTNIDLLVRSEETGRAIPPEDRKALLGSVKAQMTELADLIGDLQELSRPDSAPGAAPVQVVGLHEAAARAVERARLRATGLTMTVALDPWYVRAEAPALERAIVNLLDNAVKFSPPGGEIEVRLSGGELTVRDHGPGIPAEELPHVFDRFWRSPSARGLPGSGLGLSIVARTVRRAGGEVGLRPAEGGGTVAVVRLPGAAVEPPAEVPGG